MLLNLAGGHFAFDVLLDIREVLYVLLWLNRRLSRQLNYLVKFVFTLMWFPCQAS